jgi:hypothetical protein
VVEKKRVTRRFERRLVRDAKLRRIVNEVRIQWLNVETRPQAQNPDAVQWAASKETLQAAEYAIRAHPDSDEFSQPGQRRFKTDTTQNANMNRKNLSLFGGLALATLTFMAGQAPQSAWGEDARSSGETSPRTIAAEIDPAQFDALFAQIKPAPSELRWLEIPWIGALMEGRAAAAAMGKPMFLWAMNGHPLGTC